MPLPKIKPISTAVQSEDLTESPPPRFEANDVFYKESQGRQYTPWDTAELEEFFRNFTSRDKMVRLDSCSTIIDLPLFVESHLATVKAHSGNPRYLPDFERLQELRRILTNNLN